MTTRKSLPIGLILLLCFCLLPISTSSAQMMTGPETKIPNFDCYRDAEAIIAKMQFLAPTDSDLSELRTIGTSVGGAPIYALEIGNEANASKPHFILLAGLHGNDFSQPELGLQLAETLLEGYETDADLRWIVDNVELDLILLSNPDGRHVAEGQAEEQVGDYVDSNNINYFVNYNNVNLEENFCFPISESSEGCSTFTTEPETQAIIDYLRLKLGESSPDQSLQYDAHNFFIYFSSHNKEISPSDFLSNYKGRLRIPKFFLPYPQDLSDPALLRLAEFTEMLRIVDPNPKYNIETFETEGMRFDRYPVDFTYFTYRIASVELSAPPTYDSRPMDCDLFTTEHVQNNIQLLLNAAKSAFQPYRIGYGPIVDKLTVVETTETEVKHRAEILDKNQIPNYPERNPITSIHYYLDQPTGTVTGNLSGWEEIDTNPYISAIDFAILKDGLPPGKHILTLQACSQDEFDAQKEVCGLPRSAYLTVPAPEAPGDPDPPDPGEPDPTDTPNDPDPPDAGERKIYLPLIRR